VSGIREYIILLPLVWDRNGVRHFSNRPRTIDIWATVKLYFYSLIYTGTDIILCTWTGGLHNNINPIAQWSIKQLLNVHLRFQPNIIIRNPFLGSNIIDESFHRTPRDRWSFDKIQKLYACVLCTRTKKIKQYFILRYMGAF